MSRLAMVCPAVKLRLEVAVGSRAGWIGAQVARSGPTSCSEVYHHGRGVTRNTCRTTGDVDCVSDTSS